ncbi:hypothetical protein [Vampirovibrio chlorellavorus]|uniref:hypothetical protein n=1 Tax=Vampirovibrio chlorellavorus TaxID=758823 RepID=UPI0026EDCF1F|nr:hypothetical protein [Vampirovibrio chlorellavorus]
MKTYDFLNRELLDFVKAKQSIIFSETCLERAELQRRFWDAFNLQDPEGLWKNAIEPLEWMGTANIRCLLDFQTQYTALLFQENPEENIPLIFILDAQGNVIRGIRWVLIQASNLGIDDFEFHLPAPSSDRLYEIETPVTKKLRELYKPPYGQCLWCSLPFCNTEKLPGFVNGLRIKNPDKRFKYCHVNNCKAQKKKLYSPYQHKNCCYGKAGIVKHRFRVALEEIERSRVFDETVKRTKIIKLFTDFLEERFVTMSKYGLDVFDHSEYMEYVNAHSLGNPE